LQGGERDELFPFLQQIYAQAPAEVSTYVLWVQERSVGGDAERLLKEIFQAPSLSSQ
jgi:hypothetical protein